MFAVIGYLKDNDSLVAGLRTARKHLKKNGIFVFDGWFGPAVLAQGPEERIHEYQDGANSVVRKVTPFLDSVMQTVKVNYEIVVKNNVGDVLKRTEEEHHMRFLFVQEIKLAMEIAGLELKYACPFMEYGKELSENTWNVTFVAASKK